MKCRYCNIALAPLRSLTDGEFCCDEHRRTFFQEKVAGLVAPASGSDIPLASLHAAITEVAPEPAAAPQSVSQPVAEAVRITMPAPVREASETVAAAPASAEPEPDYPAPPSAEYLLPLRFDTHLFDSQRAAGDLRPSFDPAVRFPAIKAAPIPILDSEATYGLDGAANVPERIDHPSGEIAASWRWITQAWKNAPRDLRVITLLLPVLLAVALGPSVPKIHVAQVSSKEVQEAVSTHLKVLHQTILNRAAVAFADDFRPGLDAWDSRSNLTTSWSYDATGFVQPGPLAVFKPTVDLSDYRFEFLGEIDKRAIGAAFRVQDLDNYYAVKFVIVKPGPLPLVHLVRYPVINGKEGPHVEKPLPLVVRADMLYRVLVDVRGSDFTILAQGQVVDFWSDSRLQHGGVGFFCGRGEKARVRWVEVSHQYDALGRLCAYLAPYPMESRNGTWN